MPLLDDQGAAQRHHHQHAKNAAGKRQHQDLRVVEIAGAVGHRKINAGIVKTTPPATDSPAEPIVCTMLFSRMVEPPSFLRTEMASTAMGIDALTVRPARRPRYTVEAPNSRPNNAQDDRLGGELRHRLCCRNVRLKAFRGFCHAADSILTGAQLEPSNSQRCRLWIESRRVILKTLVNSPNKRKRTEPVSELTTNRLVYLRCLNQLESAGVDTISSQALAEQFHLNAAQIRKDLAYFGEFGVRGVGYYVKDLKRHLRRSSALIASCAWPSWAPATSAWLADYPGFKREGFEIVAMFDVAEGKIGDESKSGVPIHDLKELKRLSGARRSTSRSSPCLPTRHSGVLDQVVPTPGSRRS